ncbi:MAG: LacI family DNA-binding transcriptional regulator [Planctomycetota bacterium]
MSPTSSVNPKQANLSDVAKHAGVAVSTVSRVLNGNKKNFSVRPEVRRQIHASADRLGYRPNINARTLRGQKTGYVAVLGLRMLARAVHDPSDSVVDRMADALASQDMHLTSTFVGSQGGAYAMPPWQVESAVVVRATRPDDFAEVERSGLPYVSINNPAGPGGSSVLVDDRAGMLDALTHLFDLGHRRIAYCHRADRFGVHHSQSERLETYRAFIARRGLGEMTYGLEAEGDKDGRVDALIQSGATAVVTYNHYVAMDVIQTADRLGRSIPDNLSLVTFNDEYPMDSLHPGITCVAHPADRMAEVASRLLLEKVRGGASSSVRLPLSMVVRGSTAPPSADG